MLKEWSERCRTVLFCKRIQQVDKIHGKKSILNIGPQWAKDGDPWKTDGDCYSYPLEFKGNHIKDGMDKHTWGFGRVLINTYDVSKKTKFQREIELGMSAVISPPNILQSIDQHMFMQNFPEAEEIFRRTRDWRALGWDGGISPARMGILM